MIPLVNDYLEPLVALKNFCLILQYATIHHNMQGRQHDL